MSLEPFHQEQLEKLNENYYLKKKNSLKAVESNQDTSPPWVYFELGKTKTGALPKTYKHNSLIISPALQIQGTASQPGNVDLSSRGQWTRERGGKGK